MKNKFVIDNNIEKILNKECSDFLIPSELKEITYKLKKNTYKIYKPYKDAEKVILYVLDKPLVLLYKIVTKNELRHQDILGALFNLGLNNNSFGDIIIKDNEYYFYVLPKIKKIIESEFNKVGNYPVSVSSVSLNLLENYERCYQTLQAIVPSTRLDVIVSEIIKSNRTKAEEVIASKSVIVNYEIQTKRSYILKENDIFSIRKYGKYKFIGVIKKTKKDRIIVEYQKYL